VKNSSGWPALCSNRFQVNFELRPPKFPISPWRRIQFGRSTRRASRKWLSVHSQFFSNKINTQVPINYIDFMPLGRKAKCEYLTLNIFVGFRLWKPDDSWFRRRDFLNIALMVQFQAHTPIGLLKSSFLPTSASRREKDLLRSFERISVTPFATMLILRMTRAERLKFYSRVMYGFAEFMHFIPFAYEFRDGGPDRVVQTSNPVLWQVIASILTLTLSLATILQYFTIYFSDITMFERLTIFGISCISACMNITQWYFLLRHSQRNIIALTKAVLQGSFENVQAPTMAYELLHLVICQCSIIYPLLFFPIFLLCSLYFPSMYSLPFRWIELITTTINFEDPWHAMLFVWICRLSFLVIVSVAAAHGCVNITILALWQCMYYRLTIQSLQTLSKLEIKGYEQDFV